MHIRRQACVRAREGQRIDGPHGEHLFLTARDADVRECPGLDVLEAGALAVADAAEAASGHDPDARLDCGWLVTAALVKVVELSIGALTADTRTRLDSLFGVPIYIDARMGSGQWKITTRGGRILALGDVEAGGGTGRRPGFRGGAIPGGGRS